MIKSLNGANSWVGPEPPAVQSFAEGREVKIPYVFHKGKWRKVLKVLKVENGTWRGGD